jgi:hypothetical protein
MTAPFDTLKLARRFEAAGFDPKQAGDMAEAIAEAAASADLATKADITAVRADLVPLASKVDLAELKAATKLDLAEVKADLVKWFAGMLVVVVGLTLTGVGTATAIILNRLSATAISAPASRASLGPGNVTLAAAESQRPYSCRQLGTAQQGQAMQYFAAVLDDRLANNPLSTVFDCITEFPLTSAASVLVWERSVATNGVGPVLTNAFASLGITDPADIQRYTGFLYSQDPELVADGFNATFGPQQSRPVYWQTLDNNVP